ncbi:MAG: FG-GAP repeat domain-containing protein [Planctomycetota bacterium]|jgi:hypothetical protein
MSTCSYLAVRRILLLLTLVTASACGPVAIALGISEALKEEDPDLGQPSVQFIHESGFGAAPEFVSLATLEDADRDGRPDFKELRLIVRVDKPGARVRVDIQGPQDDLPCRPYGAGEPDDGCVIPESFSGEGVRKVSALDFLVQVPILATGPTPASHDGVSGLDGIYTLFVEVTDKQGRVVPAARQFLVDTVPPDRPALIEVAATRPRSLTVRWSPVQDLAEEGNDDDDAASGVTGYNIHFEVGPVGIDAATAPGDPSIEVPEEEEDSVLRCGLLPSADDTILESPHFVPGSNVGSFELTGLYAGRLHSVAVTAVDRAGNESFFDPDPIDGFPLDYRVVRTRIGPDGILGEDGWQLERGSECRSPRLADLDEDGALDLVFVRRTFGPDGPTMERIQVYRGVTEGGGNGVRATPTGRFEPWSGSTATDDETIDYEKDLESDGDAYGRIVDVRLADFDLDGTLDIVVLDEGTGTEAGRFGLRFYRGASDAQSGRGADGRGADIFEFVSTREKGIRARVAGPPLRLAVADADRATEIRAGDGNVRFVPDVVVSRDGADPLLFPLTRSFDTAVPGGVPLQVSAASGVVLVDHDGDGYPDVTGFGAIALRTIRAEPKRDGYALADGAGRQSVASVGGTIDDVKTADFNRDGVPDLAVSLTEGSIAILLGAGQVDGATGEGSQAGQIQFAEAKQVPIGGDGGPLVIGDFNADRIPDLAIASRGTQNLTICLGEGDNGRGTGEFRIGNRLPLFLEPTGLDVGDVDKSGTPDFVVTGFDAFDDTTPGRVRVAPLGGMTARGEGTFFDVTLERPGFRAATRVTGSEQDIVFGDAVDFDGDGILDILASATGEPFRIIRGRGSNAQGNGTFFFGAANFWALANYVDQLATGDFDGDGELDVVGVRLERPEATDEMELQVELQLKRGTEFQRSWGRVARPRQIWTDYRQLSDSSFETRPDVTSEAEKLTWVKSAVGTSVPIPADMDGDGHLDLVLLRAGVISVLMGPVTTLPGASADIGFSGRLFHDHVFRTALGELAHSQRLSTTAAIADINADGLMDVVSLDLNIITNVATTFGRRAPTLERDIPLPVDQAVQRGMAVSNSRLTYTFEGENGPFDVKWPIFPTGPWEYVLKVDWPQGSEPAADGVFRIFFRPDPDGGPGAVFADAQAAIEEGGYRPIARLAANSGLRFTIPLLPGEFDAELGNYPSPIDPWPEAQLLIVNDSGVDLPAGALTMSRGVRFDLPDKSGQEGKTYRKLPNFEIDFDPTVRQRLVEVRDFDDDGVPDLAVLAPGATAGEVFVLAGDRADGRGTGMFTFFAHAGQPDGVARYALASRPFQVRSADCNGDGILDLIVATEAPSLEILLGRADANGRATGTFLAPKRVALQDVPRATGFVLGDFNADGIVDAAVGSTGGDDPVLAQGARLLFGKGALVVDEG